MKTRIWFVVIVILFTLSCTKESTSPDDSLAAPSNLTLEQIDLESIQLAWQDNSSAEEGFRIDRKIGDDGWDLYYQILAEDTSTYIDSNLIVFDDYIYRIKAFNGDDYSNFIETEITFLDLDSLATPSNLILVLLDVCSIQLTWQDNSSAEDGFRIDRKIDDNEWEENYQILPENTTIFIDSDLVTIGNYSYRISAYSNDDYSEAIEANINFSYYDVYSISPLFSGQINLELYQSFALNVILKDSLENIVQRDYEVWFKLLSCPLGFNINNTLYGTNDSLSVQSQNGQAVASLNAGSQSGQVTLKIYVYNSNNEEISIIKNNIIVHASQPSFVEFSIGGINSGEDLGNGNWGIEVSALIMDNQGNPVAPGTAVWFSLPDNPEWASIMPAAYIGNVNAFGDSLPGVAFTMLTYDGSHTNNTISVRIETGLGDIFEDELVLPIQFPIIDIIAVPLHVDWYEIPNPTPPYQSTEIRITLWDGQYNSIDNHIIAFSTTLGEPLEPIPPDTGDPYTGLTGIVNNEHGRLNKEVEFHYQECPPPIPTPPGTTTCTITAQVFGTNTSDQVTVILRRYID